MLSIHNILVPIVFSARCAWAVRYAARLAKTFESQLIFLHVSEKSDADALEEFVTKEVGAASHRCVVLDGDPASRIVELAREVSADLIVMPTYHGRYRTFLIGSVTAKVLHDVECPVLTGVHLTMAHLKSPMRSALLSARWMTRPDVFRYFAGHAS